MKHKLEIELESRFDAVNLSELLIEYLEQSYDAKVLKLHDVADEDVTYEFSEEKQKTLFVGKR